MGWIFARDGFSDLDDEGEDEGEGINNSPAVVSCRLLRGIDVQFIET